MYKRRLLQYSAICLYGTSCGSSDVKECATSDHCLQGGVSGECLPSPGSEKHWCAFPDPMCASGQRWGVEAGDNLERTCVAASAADAGLVDGGLQYTVTIAQQGTGFGQVTSAPAGIDCPSTCTATFPQGTMITLHATAAVGSSFLGWSGDCVGNGVCSVALDTDHSVTARFELSGSALLVRQQGDTDNDLTSAVAASPDGSFVVVGRFTGMMTLGGLVLQSAGASPDAFVAKYLPDGSVVWAKRFGALSTDAASAVSIAPTGDVVVAGFFTGTVDFGGVPLTSAIFSGTTYSADTFVVKMAGTDGAVLWAKGLGGPYADYSHGISVGPTGDAFVVGEFAGTADFGGFTLTTNTSVDGYVVALAASDGHSRWARGLGSPGASDKAWSVAADDDGNVGVTGGFGGAGDFGGPVALMSTGFLDIFIAKYSGLDGAHLWSESFGDPGSDDVGISIAVDALGNVYAGGNYAGSVSFGGGTFTSVGGTHDIFLVKLTKAGGHLWSRSFGSMGGTDAASAIQVDGLGVLVSGSFDGVIDFGGGNLTSAANSEDAFLARLDDTGAHIRSMRFGGTTADHATSVAISSDGLFAATGRFSGFSEFGALSATSAGGDDGYLVLVAP